MFGHDDDDENKQADGGATVIPEPVADDSLGLNSVSDDSVVAAAPQPAEPDDTTVAQADEPQGAPAPEPSEPPIPPEPASEPNADEDLLQAHASSDSDGDGLLHIKQQALQQLSPLVDQLDQTPEEKFRTTMMMIQASDDQSLINTAYEAAGQITDEKAKAQALLDIVNEINYFTQQQKS